MNRRPSFEFVRPASPADVVAALVEYGDEAKVLAGGQSLGPMLTYGLIAPAALVDINGVAGLDGIAQSGTEIRIGTTTTQASIGRSQLLADHCPLLGMATRWIAHPGVRERGTIGGSLAHNDPAGEYPSVLLALGARVAILAPDGERTVDAAELIEERILETSIGPSDLITSILVPARGPRSGHAFTELAERTGDYAMAGAAAVVVLAEDRETVAEVRMTAVGGLYPKLLGAVGGELVGRRPSREAILAAAAAGADEAPMGDDIHASAAYRRRLFTTLAARALGAAVTAARA